MMTLCTHTTDKIGIEDMCIYHNHDKDDDIMYMYHTTIGIIP